MSILSPIKEVLPKPTARRRLIDRLYGSPYWLIVALIVSLFVTESIVMALLPHFPDLDAQTAVFLDSTLLILVTLPCLILFVFRPLALHLMERRRAEYALQREHDKLRDIMDAMKAGVYIVNRNFAIEYVNSALAAEFGPVQGRPCYRYFFDLSEPCSCCKDQEVFAGRTVHWERSFEKTGKTYDIFETPLREVDGSVSKLAMLHDVTERKKAEQELFDSRERLRSLSAHLQSAREEERASIAREIHDELGQVLATLQLHVSLVKDAVRGEQGALGDRVAAMGGLIEGAIGTVQRMCSQQRPIMLDDLGLAEALEWQAREFEKRSGIPCEIAVSLRGEGRELDGQVAIALFRIFQEALTNVLRHARASRIEASLVEKGRRIELVIRDNGRGITREESLKPGSFGLLGMRERAAMLGGKVRVVGSPRAGTAVVARIPVPRAKGGEP